MARAVPRTPSPRAAQTRSALLQAGMTLLAARPIDAIPIDDIVVCAGVAKGSFFNHFADKQDFAHAIAVALREDLDARIAEANAGVGDPLVRLVGGLCTGFELALSDRERAKVVLRSLEGATSRAHRLNRGVLADLDACVAAGVVRSEAGSDAALVFLLGIAQMAMVSLIERRLPRARAIEFLEEILRLALYGLGVAPARVNAVCRDATERFREAGRSVGSKRA